MGIDYRELKATGESIELERRESITTERDQNTLVKRKRTLLRERFPHPNANKPNTPKQAATDDPFADELSGAVIKTRQSKSELERAVDRTSVQLKRLAHEIDDEIEKLKRERDYLMYKKPSRPKRNAAIQNDQNWAGQVNVNRVNRDNIEFTIEKFSSQHKFVCTSPRYCRDEQTSCRPRMRTIGLQKDTQRSSNSNNQVHCNTNSKTNKGMANHHNNNYYNKNINNNYNGVLDVPPPTYCCFDYGGTGDAQNCYRTQVCSQRDQCCHKVCERYKVTNNYNGVLCAQDTYKEKGITPCSEYNYCRDEFHYDYSNGLTSAPMCSHSPYSQQLTPCPPYCECSQKKPPVPGRCVSDLQTETFCHRPDSSTRKPNTPRSLGSPVGKNRADKKTKKDSAEAGRSRTKERNQARESKGGKDRSKSRASKKRGSDNGDKHHSRRDTKSKSRCKCDSNGSGSDGSKHDYCVQSKEKLLKITVTKECFTSTGEDSVCRCRSSSPEPEYSKETKRSLKKMQILAYMPCRRSDDEDSEAECKSKHRGGRKSPVNADKRKEKKYTEYIDKYEKCEHVRHTDSKRDKCRGSRRDRSRGSKPSHSPYNVREQSADICDELISSQLYDAGQCACQNQQVGAPLSVYGAQSPPGSARYPPTGTGCGCSNYSPRISARSRDIFPTEPSIVECKTDGKSQRRKSPNGYAGGRLSTARSGSGDGSARGDKESGRTSTQRSSKGPGVGGDADAAGVGVAGAGSIYDAGGIYGVGSVYGGGIRPAQYPVPSAATSMDQIGGTGQFAATAGGSDIGAIRHDDAATDGAIDNIGRASVAGSPHTASGAGVVGGPGAAGNASTRAGSASGSGRSPATQAAGSSYTSPGIVSATKEGTSTEQKYRVPGSMVRKSDVHEHGQASHGFGGDKATVEQKYQPSATGTAGHIVTPTTGSQSDATSRKRSAYEVSNDAYKPHSKGAEYGSDGDAHSGVAHGPGATAHGSGGAAHGPGSTSHGSPGAAHGPSAAVHETGGVAHGTGGAAHGAGGAAHGAGGAAHGAGGAAHGPGGAAHGAGGTAHGAGGTVHGPGAAHGAGGAAHGAGGGAHGASGAGHGAGGAAYGAGGGAHGASGAGHGTGGAAHGAGGAAYGPGGATHETGGAAHGPGGVGYGPDDAGYGPAYGPDGTLYGPGGVAYGSGGAGGQQVSGYRGPAPANINEATIEAALFEGRIPFRDSNAPHPSSYPSSDSTHGYVVGSSKLGAKILGPAVCKRSAADLLMSAPRACPCPPNTRIHGTSTPRTASCEQYSHSPVRTLTVGPRIPESIAQYVPMPQPKPPTDSERSKENHEATTTQATIFIQQENGSSNAEPQYVPLSKRLNDLCTEEPPISPGISPRYDFHSVCDSGSLRSEFQPICEEDEEEIEHMEEEEEGMADAMDTQSPCDCKKFDYTDKDQLIKPESRFLTKRGFDCASVTSQQENTEQRQQRYIPSPRSNNHLQPWQDTQVEDPCSSTQRGNMLPWQEPSQQYIPQPQRLVTQNANVKKESQEDDEKAEGKKQLYMPEPRVQYMKICQETPLSDDETGGYRVRYGKGTYFQQQQQYIAQEQQKRIRNCSNNKDHNINERIKFDCSGINRTCPPQIPEFTGCPCMLQTYLNMITMYYPDVRTQVRFPRRNQYKY